MAEYAEPPEGGSVPRRRPGSRLGRWFSRRVAEAGQERCPYCRASPLHSVAEMVVFTNCGYRFPRVAVTYCALCDQLLGAHLADQVAACGCAANVESDIAESDTLPFRNPYRLTDIVFDSCARCGQVHACGVHY
jgi:hypothetical protein